MKYTDNTNTIVFWTNPNGAVESCLASILPEGTVIEPADPPTAAELNAPIYAQLQALDMKLIRPLAENDQARIDAINAEKETLRSQLV